MDPLPTSDEHNIEPDAERDVETQVPALASPGPGPPYWLFWHIAAYSIVVVPVVCFIVLLSAPPGGVAGPPKWQNGQPQDYARLLLNFPASLGFLPLWIYSMACGMFLLGEESKGVRHLGVRFGVYTGAVLSLNYLCLYVYAVFGEDMFDFVNAAIAASSIFWGCIPLLVLYLTIRFFVVLRQRERENKETDSERERFRRRFLREYKIYVGILAVCWIIGLVIASVQSGGALMGIPLLIVWCLVSSVLGTFLIGPFFTLGSYIWLTLRIRRHQGRRFRFSLAWLFLLMGWFGLFLAAWQYAIREMFRLYGELPTTPPPSSPSNCYVATAAARGRPRRVGSWEVRAADGTTFRVNRQLIYLKAGELALKAVFPRLHSVLRRIYDTIGPPLARRIRHPLAAEAVYWSLKPFEWTVRLTLPLLVPDWDTHLPLFYKNFPRTEGPPDAKK